MSYVVVNALQVPAGSGAELERRFGARLGAVENAAGFEHFELLRPVAGTETYLVYTRWQTKADFEAWQSSQDFERGHGQTADSPRRAPVAAGSEIWAFEVVQTA